MRGSLVYFLSQKGSLDEKKFENLCRTELTALSDDDKRRLAGKGLKKGITSVNIYINSSTST